jgi:hypothetical protein
MTTNLPSDIELSFPYRDLVSRMGAVKAAFLFLRLWSDLAQQVRTHGRSGICEARFVELYRKSIAEATVDGDAVAILTECGLVQAQSNGDLLCPIFHDYNEHLDASFVPMASKWLAKWQKFEADMKERAPLMNTKVPTGAWYYPDGTVITDKEMNRAIVLISTLDLIFKSKPRRPEDMGIGLLQSAAKLVQTHSEVKLSAVLSRAMGITRKKRIPGFPLTTEDAIKRFDDFIILVMPTEGFEAWSKRVSKSPDDHEPSQEKANTAIGRELDTAAAELSGVSA